MWLCASLLFDWQSAGIAVSGLHHRHHQSDSVAVLVTRLRRMWLARTARMQDICAHAHACSRVDRLMEGQTNRERDRIPVERLSLIITFDIDGRCIWATVHAHKYFLFQSAMHDHSCSFMQKFNEIHASQSSFAEHLLASYAHFFPSEHHTAEKFLIYTYLHPESLSRDEIADCICCLIDSNKNTYTHSTHIYIYIICIIISCYKMCIYMC